MGRQGVTEPGVITGIDQKGCIRQGLDHLFAEGVFVNPVLPPAVPPGMSLLRTSYMATHTQEDLDHILRAFRKVGEKYGIIGLDKKGIIEKYGM